jgi:paraquat-inducible protein B
LRFAIQAVLAIISFYLMSVRAKPTVIGLFVSGAIVLAVAAVLLFGSGKFFSHREKFVIYFTDSVNGLSVGSPVKFKGVQIGEVTDIKIHYDQPDDSDAIPVFIEVDTTRLHRDLGDNTDLSDPEKLKLQVTENGLRARLQMLSFVTAQLYVDLDDELSPSTPKYVGLTHPFKEIPSEPSGLSEIVKSFTTAIANLSKVDFVEMSNKINHLSDQLSEGIGQLDFKTINTSLVAAANNLNALLSDPKIKEALDKMSATLDDLDRLASNINQQVQPLSDEIQTTTKRARVTLDQINQTLTAVRDVVAPDSPLHTELDKALLEITNASRSVRILSEYLEANPRALLTGKAPPSNSAFGPLSGLTPAAAAANPPENNPPMAVPGRAGGK